MHQDFIDQKVPIVSLSEKPDRSALTALAVAEIAPFEQSYRSTSIEATSHQLRRGWLF